MIIEIYHSKLGHTSKKPQKERCAFFTPGVTPGVKNAGRYAPMRPSRKPLVQKWR